MGGECEPDVPRPLESARSVRRVLLVASCLCLAACHKKAQSCRDDQCPDGQVCFADGCGDPARNIRVEATPSTAGRASRDIQLDEVRGRQDLQLDFPPLLQGSVTVTAADPARVLGYSENAVVVRGKGVSEIIPGLTRTFEITLPPPSAGNPEAERSLNPDGTFRFAASPGAYSITLSTLDPSIPPGTAQASTTLRSGAIANVDLPMGAVRPGVPMFFNVTDANPADLEVQAFSDPTGLRPLSQRVSLSVSWGRGLELSPSVRQSPTFYVRVSPTEPGAFIPQKTFGPFTLNPPSVQVTIGDYGEPVSVTGTVVDARGTPAAGVTVYTDGAVGGNGTFRSQSAQTDELGKFAITTLRSAPGSTSSLWAIPPARSRCGILRLSVPIGGPTALGGIPCLDKIVAQGNVYNTDEAPVPGAAVVATPVQQLPGKPLPGSGDQTVTDDAGAFSLKLNPAVYQLDFIPAGQLPRTSRFAIVDGQVPSSGGYPLVMIPDVFLSKGRKISGVVYAVPSPGVESASLAPITALRFFRLTTDVNGAQSSVLLAETVSDGTGAYSVVLPTR